LLEEHPGRLKYIRVVVNDEYIRVVHRRKCIKLYQIQTMECIIFDTFIA
jgi:hypothetical protein